MLAFSTFFLYSIGTREIKRAHKSIHQQRLEIASASWQADTIDPLLVLRLLKANEWQEDF
jgi:hypothetical protein